MNSRWERRASKLENKPMRIHGRSLLMTLLVTQDKAQRARASRKPRFNGD